VPTHSCPISRGTCNWTDLKPESELRYLAGRELGHGLPLRVSKPEYGILRARWHLTSSMRPDFHQDLGDVSCSLVAPTFSLSPNTHAGHTSFDTAARTPARCRLVHASIGHAALHRKATAAIVAEEIAGGSSASKAVLSSGYRQNFHKRWRSFVSAGTFIRRAQRRSSFEMTKMKPTIVLHPPLVVHPISPFFFCHVIFERKENER